MQNYPRILLYCHNTIGLGHVIRTGTIAAALRKLEPALNVLVVTGAKRLKSSFFPENINYLKLPSVQAESVDNRSVLVSDNLSMSVSEVFKLRSALLKTLIANYRPSVLLVDNSPLGLNQELQASLEFCRTSLPTTKIVLGMRGISKGADDATYFQKFQPALEVFYDHLLFYTDRHLLDVVAHYNLPERLTAKARYVGYVTRAASYLRPADSESPVKKIVVAAGSGSLGYPALKAALELARIAPREWEFVFCAGLYMSKTHYQELKQIWQQLSNRPQVTFTRFVEDFPGLLQTAHLFIGRGGYNTLLEVALAGCPALIVPYEFENLQEQTLNARLWASRSQLTLLPEAELTPHRLLTEAENLLLSPPSLPSLPLDTNGAANTAKFLRDLAYTIS